MLDVNAVIEGKFEPSTMFEALEASVLVEDMAERVEKGRANVFGYCLIRARNVYATFKAQAEGWNDETPWYVVAANVFSEEAAQAIAGGDARGYSKKQMNTFSNAVRSLKKAMTQNAPLDERDEASGNFVLSGKSAIEKWNKAEAARQEAQEREQSAAALKAQGINVQGLTDEKGSEESAETSAFAEIQDPHIQAAVAKFAKLIAREEKVLGVEEALKSLEMAHTKVERYLDAALARLAEQTQSLKEAANQ